MADIDARLEAARKRDADNKKTIRELEAKKLQQTAKAIAGLTKGERAQDTKRKILVGATVLNMIETDRSLRGKVEAALRDTLRDADMKLFAELFGFQSKDAAPDQVVPNIAESDNTYPATAMADEQ